MTRNNRRPWLRRQLIVDRKLQLEIVYRTLGGSILLLIALTIGLFLPLIRELNSGSEATVEGSMATMLYMHAHFWPIALLCLVLSAVSSLRLSHRIAGPLVPLKRQLKALTRGEFLDPVTTRARDLLKHEVELFNDLAASWSEHIASAKEAQEEVAAAVAACAQLLDATYSRDIRDAVACLREKEGILRESLEFFRLDDNHTHETSRTPPSPVVTAH